MTGSEGAGLAGAQVPALETIEIAAGVFKDTCLQLMDEVNERPRQYVITKRGRPVAKLVPPDRGGPSGFGFLRGTVRIEGDLVSPDHAAWSEPES